MLLRSLLIAVAVLVPVVVASGVGAYVALWRVEQGVRSVAQSALLRAEDVAGRVRSSLEGYRSHAAADCDGGLVKRFQHDIKKAAYLRHMGVFAADLMVHCSDGGRRAYPLTTGAGPATAVAAADGVMLAAQKARAAAATSSDDAVASAAPAASAAVVVLAVRGPAGDGVFAIFDARGLVDGFEWGGWPGGRLTLRLANGVPVIAVPDAAGDHGAWFGLGPVVVDLRSEWMPLHVEAVADRPSVGDAVRGSLVYSLPAGLLLGLGAGAATAGAAVGSLRLRGRLRRAVRLGEIEVHYQPIVRLRDDRCVGAEALMRWHHPREGLIGPETFIPQIESTDAIITLTHHVMGRVADDLPALIAIQPDVQVSINLAAVHLEAATLGEDVLRIFTACGHMEHLIFEATERQLIVDEVAAERCIRHLRAAGMRVYLDDFGTGHSSFAYLQRFPVDGIKIAQQFVSEIGTDAPRRSVIDAIITMGQGLDLEMIAEGVETEEQASYLKDANVGFGQGFYWAPPLPLDGFLDYLRRNTNDT